MADPHPDQQAVAGPLGKQVLSLESMSAECQILERALCPASVKIIAVQVTGRYSPSLKQFTQKLIKDPVSLFVPVLIIPLTSGAVTYICSRDILDRYDPGTYCAVDVKDAPVHLHIPQTDKRHIRIPEFFLHADNIVVEAGPPVLQEEIPASDPQFLKAGNDMVSQFLRKARDSDRHPHIIHGGTSGNHADQLCHEFPERLHTEPSPAKCSFPGVRRHTDQTVLTFSGQGQCLRFFQALVIPGDLGSVSGDLYAY